MKFKKALAFIIVSSSFSFSQSIQPDSLSINDAVKLALMNQPLIEEAIHGIEAAEANIKQEDSYNYPLISSDISYVRIGPIPSIQFGGMGFTLVPDNNYDAHISASQLIYDFGKRNASIELAKSNRLSAEDKIGLIKNSLTYQTIGAFYTVLFLEKSIDVKKEQIETLMQHLELAKKKVQSGSATDFDVLTTEVRVASAENQKIDIENSLAKQKIFLKNLTGLPSDSRFEVKGELNINSDEPELNLLIDQAFNQRAELKLAHDAESSSILSKEAISLDNRPRLKVFGNYGFKNGFEPNLNVLRGNWSAGLAASIPIFDGNLKDARVEQAEANIKTNTAKISGLQRNIKTEVEQALSDLNSSRLKIKITEIQVKQAKDAVTRAQNQYKAGVITNLDLLDAETSLSEAELLYNQAIYQNVINGYSLDKAVGKEYIY